MRMRLCLLDEKKAEALVPDLMPSTSSSSSSYSEEVQLTRTMTITSVDKSRLKMVFLSLAISNGPCRNLWSLSLDGFKKAIHYLDANISAREMVEMFSRFDRDRDGFISFEEFQLALTNHANWSQFCLTVPPSFTVRKVYDYTKSTNENYGMKHKKFWGKYVSIRESLDYDYHTNYTKKRQLWQDEVVSSLFAHSTPEKNPWIVYTCGAMGAGKGYVMRWLLANGYLPLKKLVQIDPDYFKTLMPEWEGYLDNDPVSAGTLCHRESSFIQEIAQEVALTNRIHTWVDGSLRDYMWYSDVFEDIRLRFPEYSIAIFYVHAPPALVRQRISIRTIETGRKIPENLILECLKANHDSISFLGDKVDFVARILNGKSKIPVLETFESVDRSGNWDRLRVKFDNKVSQQQAFPKGLGPLILMRTNITEPNLVFDKQQLEDISSSRVVKGKIGKDMNIEKVLGFMKMTKLYLSPVRTQNMGTTKVCLAHIPYETHTFAWCNPALLNMKAKINLDITDPNAMFFIYGGFVYFDVNFNVTGVNAVAGLNQKLSTKNQHMVLFGESQVLIVSSALALQRERRWGNVTLPHLLAKGAKHLAWIAPGEKVGGVRFPRFGGFAFLFQTLESLLKVPSSTLSNKASCGMFYPMLG